MPWDISYIALPDNYGNFQLSPLPDSTISQCDLSADGRILALVTEERTGVIDFMTRSHWTDFCPESQSIVASSAAIRCLEFSPDRPVLASGSDDGSLRLWDVEFGPYAGTPNGPTTPVLAWSGHRGAIWDLRWSAALSLLASCGEDGTVRVWHPDQRTQIAQLDARAGAVESIDWMADAPLVAAGYRDGWVRVWDTQRHSIRREFQAHVGAVTAVRFSQDGSKLVTGGRDESVHVWETATQRRMSSSRGHLGGVKSLTIHRDGRRFIVCQSHGCAEIRDLASGALHVSVLSCPLVGPVVSTPNGAYRPLSWDQRHPHEPVFFLYGGFTFGVVQPDGSPADAPIDAGTPSTEEGLVRSIFRP